MQCQSDNIQEIAAAIATAQAAIPPAAKNAQNPHLRNRYADLAAVWAAVRDELPKHGLAVVQTMVPRDDGKACVRTLLTHTSGQWIAGECALPVPKADPQGYGSAITYARRYSLSAMLGVVSEDDDDAEGAGARAKKRDVQQQRDDARAAQPPMNQALRKAFQTAMSKRYAVTHDAEAKRALILNELSEFFARPISTSNELTDAEVKEFLDAIKE